MTTNTPRTNSATFEVRANNRAVPIDVVAASFAEGLERELNASKAEVERLRDALDTLTLVVGLTPVAGNKSALQEAYDLARKALKQCAAQW